MSFVATLVITILFVSVWLFFSALIMLYIKFEAKKKWKKNVKLYPYFSYPFYKKIFLFGLKGALNPIVVIVTFILNVSVILLVTFGMWELISPNILVTYILRIIVGIYGVSFFSRLGCFLAFPLSL